MQQIQLRPGLAKSISESQRSIELGQPLLDDNCGRSSLETVSAQSKWLCWCQARRSVGMTMAVGTQTGFACALLDWLQHVLGSLGGAVSVPG